MDRLTKRVTDGQAMMDCEKCKADWTGKHGKSMVDCTPLYCRNRLKDRLAAYEETGLTPEQCENAKAIIEYAFSADTSKAERIRELAEADKDGRVVVLPVKPVLTPIISSMLYIIDDGDIYEDALYEAEVGMSESGKTNVIYTTLSDLMIFEQAEIGKTVFLTREEAEKALEAMKDE